MRDKLAQYVECKHCAHYDTSMGDHDEQVFHYCHLSNEKIEKRHSCDEFTPGEKEGHTAYVDTDGSIKWVER